MLFLKRGLFLHIVALLASWHRLLYLLLLLDNVIIPIGKYLGQFIGVAANYVFTATCMSFVSMSGVE